MWQQIRNNPRAAALAVLAHIVFIAILVLSFTFSRDETESAKGPELEVIKAQAIDEKQIDARIKRLRDAETRKQQKIKEQAIRQKQARLRELARQAEKKRLIAEKKAEKKKHLAVEKKRKQAALKRKQKEKAEKKRQAQLQIERQRQKRLLQEKKRRQAEQKRIKEEERKQQEELARQEAEMKQKLDADRRRQQEVARKQANQQEISKYLGQIKNAVTRHWTLPAQEVKGLRCEVKVRIIPNGEVIDVQIIKSSGNLAFDRSVETAVYRAAPLPVPSIDSGLFDEFREVIFSFEPRDL
ncbi:MAG TPA: cell envelope integrity protein TolA [Gammaproteobacteria bacterium]|nr:cell envelope integrity protein TolA [Gammaproteobacteria bacterium]